MIRQALYPVIHDRQFLKRLFEMGASMGAYSLAKQLPVHGHPYPCILSPFTDPLLFPVMLHPLPPFPVAAALQIYRDMEIFRQLPGGLGILQPKKTGHKTDLIPAGAAGKAIEPPSVRIQQHARMAVLMEWAQAPSF